MDKEEEKGKIKEEKMKVKEEKPEVKEQKPKVKKRCTSLYNKYKRKREDDEDTGDYKIYKKGSAPGYFQYACELLSNDEKTPYEIYKEYPSIFIGHYNSLERILYERDRLKKRAVPEVTWIFGPSNAGEIEWVDKYIDLYDMMYKFGNYYHIELKVKYRYYNFLPEKLIIISRVNPQEWCSKCKLHIDECSELLKRVNRIIECLFDPATSSYPYTDRM
jgi:hypothetical protein